MSNIIVHDGRAGAGKTHAILSRQDEFDGALTVTRSAAAQLVKRGWTKPCKTIYQATAKHLRPYVARWAGASKSAAADKRPIEDAADDALLEWVRTAPSRRARTVADALSERLHGWDVGEMPLTNDEIASFSRAPQLAFVLPMAWWLGDGAPLADGPRRTFRVACDEFQDWSSLEIRCALALGADLEGYGDAGQAIFAGAKGSPPGALPAGWRMAHEIRPLGPSRRCGPDLSTYADACLLGAPQGAWASHQTEVIPWDDHAPRSTGLALAYSREIGGRFFKQWGLTETWVRATELSAPNERFCMATIHDAKGMEADDVYMLPWPDAASRSAILRDPETLLLLYTAITRARKRLFIPRPLHFALQQCLALKIST